MAIMRLEVENTDDTVTVRLYNNETPEAVVSTFKDTANGFEVKTVGYTAAGEQVVLTDKTDRGTPPLNIVMNNMTSLYNSLIANAQAHLNRQRLKRLVTEGHPITQKNMCMDGLHTGDEFDVPFQGGIVGIPTYSPDPDETEAAVREESEVNDDFLRAMWGPESSDDDDDEREGVEV